MPSIKSIYAIFGSARRLNILKRMPISILFIFAPLVFNTTAPFSVIMLLPLIAPNNSSISFAIRSITFNFSASSAVIETLFLTASSAHCSFLPLLWAMPFMYAAASFSSFAAISPFVSPPLMLTGCAAPIFVPGVIAAICAAIAIKVPADAALAPLGAT